MSESVSIIIVLVCLVFSAYFSATETAFSTVNRARLKAQADKGDKTAKSVLKLSDDFDTMLSTILIGNNIVNILSASLATLLFVSWINESTGPTVSTIVMTVIVLVFGEVTPKSIAKEHPEKFAAFAAPLLKTLMFIFAPLNWIFKQWKKVLSKVFKANEEEKMTEEELISIVKEAEEEGEFDKDEGQIIKSAIEFNDLEIGDIFTPRVDVTAIASDLPNEEVAKVFVDTGYSRIPVYKDEFDNVIGILYYKDFYAAKEREKEFDIVDLLKPVIYLTKNQMINDVLKQFQEKQLHFGVILDEFGSIAGVVTLEDIVEEIVGEIWDEHDQIENEIKQVSEKEYIVSGKTSIVKLFNLLEVYSEETEEVDSLTVNGFVMENLSCIPAPGMEFEWEGFNVKVLKMNGKRIDTVRILDNRPEEEEE
jgi:CBS domain containing-hemolysin-like protein